MKKIIYVIGLGVLFLASFGQVNAAWNTYPSDCPNPLSIGNYTTGEGIQDGSNGCWTRKSVSVDAGQTINVAVYYDNTNTTNADNTVIKITQSPTGSMTSKNSTYTFYGNLTSSAGSLNLSQVTANLSSSETLTFSRARWYKKTDTVGISLPNGQTGYEAFNGGLSMGTIAKDDWGTILFSFSVGKTVTPPATCSILNFNANPLTIQSGSSSDLSWATSNCNSVSISSVGTVNNSGVYTVRPTTTMTYTLSAYGTNSQDSKNVTVVVNQPEPKVMTGYLTATPTSCVIPKGSSSCQVSLNWNTTNPVSTSLVTLPDRTVIFTGNSGTKNISVSNGYKTYYLENNGSNLDEERVSASCATGSTWNGTYCAQNDTPSPLVCSIKDFTANLSSIDKGSSTTLVWQTSNCTSASISGVSVATTGSKTYTPQATTTYTLVASNSNGSTDSLSRTVIVKSIQPVMSGNISASPINCKIAIGDSSCYTTLSWNTINPIGVSTVTKPVNQTIASGNTNSKTVSVTNGTNSFYLYNSNVELDSVYVSASCSTGSYWNGTYCTPTVNPTCTINSFTASPTTINKGSSTTLYWNTSNCTSANLSGESVSVSGSKNVSPQNTITYILSANGLNGSDFKSVTVNVNSVNPINNCSLTSFTVNGRSSDTVDYREKTTLAWTSEYCNFISITPYVNSNLNPNDSEVIYPTNTTTYTITAYGNNDSSDTRTAKVIVLSDDDEDDYCVIDRFRADDREIEYGDETNIEWETEGCESVKISNIGSVSRTGDREVSPSRSTKYTLTAYGYDGDKQERDLYVAVVPRGSNINYDYCSIEEFRANRNYINSGEAVTLSWDTNDCNSVNISLIGSVSSSGSRPVYPSGTTNYLLTAYGRNGEILTRSLSVVVNNFITPPIIPVTPVYNSCAVTTVATNITGSSATLNGFVSGSSNGNGYFEYGTTVGLGNRTSSRPVYNGVSFSETIQGLSSNNIYYFRFVADCQGGAGFGAIDTFRTLGSSVVRPVVIQGTTVVGQASPVILKIENRYEAIGRGDTIEYTVTYKNIGKSVLRNPILQVIVPEGITIRNASRGTYQEDTRTLTVELDDLSPGEEGTLFVQGYVTSIKEGSAKIVSTALLVYTNTSGAQENAIAYVLNIPKEFSSNGNNLGAAAFFSGLFGGSNCSLGLIGWLLLIIIILLIILIIRRYFFTPRNSTYVNNPTYPQNPTH